jgi:hypothetical protein
MHFWVSLDGWFTRCSSKATRTHGHIEIAVTLMPRREEGDWAFLSPPRTSILSRAGFTFAVEVTLLKS